MCTHVPSSGFMQGAGQFTCPSLQLSTAHLLLPLPLHWKHGWVFSSSPAKAETVSRAIMTMSEAIFFISQRFDDDTHKQTPEFLHVKCHKTAETLAFIL